MRSDSLILLGKITRPRGLTGELVIALKQHPGEINRIPDAVWMGDDLNHLCPWRLNALQIEDRTAFLKLNDVHSREEAELLRDLEVFIEPCFIRRPICEDIVGFGIFDRKSGHFYGRVISTRLNEVNPLIIIDTGEQQFMIPAVPEFIHAIDYQERRLIIDPIPGLLPW